MIGSILEAGLDLLGLAFESSNVKEKRKYADRCIELKLALYKERQKPMHEQDDGLMEDLYNEYFTLIEFAKSEIYNTASN